MNDGIDGLAAIVLAAGLSRRMGRLKPLLPLGQTTVLETAVSPFTEAGIRRLIVVTGHRADQVGPLVARQGWMEAPNPDYRTGMYSSVRAGVAALPAGTAAFFLLPCDIPLVKAATVRQLAAARQSAGRDPAVCYPVFGGRRGHPPLISAALIPQILAGEPDGGLRALLAGHSEQNVEVEVPDEGILRDMDTPEAYERIRNA